MTGTVLVTSLVRTGDRSPSKWEGETYDGRRLYVRYKWGLLSIGIGNSIADAVEHSANFFEKQLGDKLDGSLEFEQLRAVTNGLIQWPEKCGHLPSDFQEIDFSQSLEYPKS
jgi:hypothetical protein